MTGSVILTLLVLIVSYCCWKLRANARENRNPRLALTSFFLATGAFAGSFLTIYFRIIERSLYDIALMYFSFFYLGVLETHRSLRLFRSLNEK